MTLAMTAAALQNFKRRKKHIKEEEDKKVG